MLFNIGMKKEKFTFVLKDYFYRVNGYSEVEAYQKAKESMDFLLEGLDLDGNTYKYNEDTSFASRIERVTEKFYKATETEKRRLKIKNYHKTIKQSDKINGYIDKKNQKREVPIEERKTVTSDKVDAAKIKKQLYKEFPFLNNRKDLEETLDNYCILSVKVKNLLSSAKFSNVAVKNLIETQIKLGQYLGISESERQKQKIVESKDNIASLSLQYQQTIEELPNLVEELSYFEIRILLKKYERKELTRDIFKLDSYAGMYPEEAYMLVNKLKKKYESE